LDRVLAAVVDGRRLGDVVRLPVHAGALEAGAADPVPEGLISSLPPSLDGSHHVQPPPLPQRPHLLHDPLGRPFSDGDAAGRAVGLAQSGVEDAQVIVNLGDRADRRARALAGGLLLDADGGRQAADTLDLWLLHLAQELAGVTGQRLDVAALALGVD